MPKEDRYLKTGTAGGDLPSAKMVLLNAAQSALGRARLTTQAYSGHEQAAITLLTGNGTNISAVEAVIFNEALLPYVAGLTSSSTWGNVITKIAAS